MSGFEGYEDLLKKLGKCKTGKGCLYINRLSDVHMPTLKAMIKKSFQHMKAIHKRLVIGLFIKLPYINHSRYNQRRSGDAAVVLTVCHSEPPSGQDSRTQSKRFLAPLPKEALRVGRSE
jgi:hypothetical protein